MSAGGMLIYGPKLRGRDCAACKACGTIVPVELPEGNKPANTRCRHLCSKGCRIYVRRPEPCRMWSCRWLFDPMATGLRRPDLSGYIIDPMLDTVLADGQPVEVLQIWVDPKRPEAHRAPELRAYLHQVAGKHRIPALVRWNSADAMLIVAPPLTENGEWFEGGGAINTRENMVAKIKAAGAVVNPMSIMAEYAP